MGMAGRCSIYSLLAISLVGLHLGFPHRGTSAERIHTGSARYLADATADKKRGIQRAPMHVGLCIQLHLTDRPLISKEEKLDLNTVQMPFLHLFLCTVPIGTVL